ncbi:MAG: HepT-like ribonuclease domain-containing protein [Actinomycetota bacterium]
MLAESTKRLSDDVKDSRSEVDWAAIAGFRNVLVHEYLGVDLGEVWQVATRDLSQLRTAVEDALKAMGSVDD